MTDFLGYVFWIGFFIFNPVLAVSVFIALLLIVGVLALLMQ